MVLISASRGRSTQRHARFPTCQEQDEIRGRFSYQPLEQLARMSVCVMNVVNDQRKAACTTLVLAGVGRLMACTWIPPGLCASSLLNPICLGRGTNRCCSMLQE